MSDRYKSFISSLVNLRLHFLLTAGFVAVAVNLGNLGAYFFQVLLSHSLSKSDYGDFNFLFTIVLMLLTPTPAVATILVHIHGSKRSAHVWTMDAVAMLFMLSSVALAVGVLLILFLVSGLSFALCLGASLLFLFSLLQMVATGVRQMSQRHGRVALAQTSIGLVRAGGAGLLIGAGAPISVADAMMICVLASCVACLLLVPGRRPLAYVTCVRESYESLRLHFRDICKIVGPLLYRYARLMLAFALLQNADLLIVGLRWPGDLAGDYAGASVLARIGFLIPASMFTLTFSEIVLSRGAASISERSLADTSFLMTVLAAVGAALFFLFFSQSLLIYLFNSAYSSASGVTAQLGAAMALLALLQAMIFKLHAKENALRLAPLGFFAGAFVIVAGLVVQSPSHVASVLLAVVLASVLIYGKMLIFPSVKRRN